MATNKSVCATCGLEGAWSCTPNTWHDEAGNPIDAMPYDGSSGPTCPECGVRTSGYHHAGCSLEEIPQELWPAESPLPDMAALEAPRSASAPSIARPQPPSINPILYQILFSFGYLLANLQANRRLAYTIAAIVAAMLVCRCGAT